MSESSVSSWLKGLWAALGGPLAAFGIALLVGVAVVLAVGQSPIEAYRYFLLGSFASWPQFGNMLAIATPLMAVAISVVVAFRAGVFNIGSEGQLYLGAIAAAVAATSLVGLPGPLLVLAALLAGALFGGLWGLVPAYLRTSLGVSEVVSTIMLNYVAILLCQYLVSYVFLDPTAGFPATRAVPEEVRLANLIPTSSASTGFFVALGLVLLLGFLLYRTVWGQQVRFVGENPRFAEAAGVPVTRRALESMLVAGGAAGVAGGLLVLGSVYRFIPEISPGYGFIGITVALLARLNPWGVLAASLLYASMMNGASIMQQNTPVPYPLVSILQGVLILLVTAQLGLSWRRRSRQLRAVQAQE